MSETEILSPDNRFIATIAFGRERCSALTSGYGRPSFATTVSIHALPKSGPPIWQWNEDSEQTEVTFSDDGKYVEILWQLAGCILNSSGTRYGRHVFHLESGIELTHDSSDYSRGATTRSGPSPTRGTASHDLGSRLRKLLRDASHASGEFVCKAVEDLGELHGFLTFVADCGVDVSGNGAVLRDLFAFLVRDLHSWTTAEVELRLQIMRILNNVQRRDAGKLFHELIPRGRVREPRHDEHNRLIDSFCYGFQDPAGAPQLAKASHSILWTIIDKAVEAILVLIDFIAVSKTRFKSMCARLGNERPVAASQCRDGSKEVSGGDLSK